MVSERFTAAEKLILVSLRNSAGLDIYMDLQFYLVTYLKVSYNYYYGAVLFDLLNGSIPNNLSS